MDPKFKITSGLLKAYKSEEDGSRRLKTTASSTIQDHGKDRMSLNAINRMAASAKENMTIFLNHSYTVPEDVLGSVEDAVVREAGRGPDGVIYDLDFDVRVNEANPRAVNTWDAIESGTKLGTSIGAIVKDYDKNTDGGWDINDVELLEASIVGIPANPRSWVHYARKALELNAEEPEDDEPEEDGEGTAEVTYSNEEAIRITGTFTTSDQWVETSMCPGCNKSEADCTCSDGCECGKKDQEPELIKDEPSEATDELDEASAQEAEADPESAEADPAGDEVSLAAEVERAKEIANPETDADWLKLAEYVNDFASKVAALSTELEEEREIRYELQQRVDDAEANLQVAKQIIDMVADLPLPRKSRMDKAVSEFRTRLGGVYSAEFLKMLENTNG